MDYVPIILTMLASIAVPLVIALFIAWLVRKMNATTVRKKTVFTIVTSIIIFPILIPIGGGGNFPIPHAIALVLAFIFSEPAQVWAWYGGAFRSIIVSFVITFVVLRGMSSLLFPQDVEKK